MPSTLRAEALVGIPEVIDGSQHIEPETPAFGAGPALKARKEILPRFPPLGAPDMLYTRKRYVPVVGPSKTFGYYHFVRGVDPSSVAKVSAYIVEVIRNNGLDPLPWVSTGGWDISSATFVTYNLLAKADLIVHVDFPGGTTAQAYDRNNNLVELTDLFWNQLHASSVIRDYMSHGEQPSYPCLRVISPVSSPARDSAFLEAAEKCAHTWVLSGTETSESPAESPAKSRVAWAIRNFLLANARFELAEEFFSGEALCAVDPLCALHAAAAARLRGDFTRAESLVGHVIQQFPSSDVAWLERSCILRAQGNLAEALGAAKKAAEHTADELKVWVHLAQLYVDSKEYVQAFDALNSADVPPPTLDPFLRALAPNRKNLTSPTDGASRGSDAVRTFASRMREEKNITNDKTDEVLSDLPSKLMSDADHSCYAVLVKILNDLSWDDMLGVRGKCFVMEADMDHEVEVARGANGGANAGRDAHANVSPDGEQATGQGASNLELDANGFTQVSLTGSSESRGNGSNGTEGGEGGAQDNARQSADVRKRNFEKMGKRVCKPWLDYLVNNMYHDLRALALWNAEEQQQAAASSLAAAALAKKVSTREGTDVTSTVESVELEAQDTEDTFRRSPEEIMGSSERPFADWLRRGELALRLEKIEDARTAFTVCMMLAEKDKKTCTTALIRLIVMAVNDGDARTAVKLADAVWNYLDKSSARKSSSEPTPPVPEIRKAVFNLVSKKGLRAIREVVTDKVEVDKKRMEGLLLDSVALRVHGFSR